MLDVIKSIINRKRSFLEAANLILEDMENDEIMDSLLDDKLTSDDSSEEDSSSSEEDSGFDTIGDSSDDLSFEDDSDDSGSIADDGIDDSMMIKDDESTPDDEISDIFSISVDTRTNTVRDILPVPMNAADAVVGDSDAKLDSGFANECGDSNPMDGFLDESGVFYRGETAHRFLFEGIDDGSGDSSSDSDSPSMDGGDDVPDAPSPDAGEESEVTTAVKQDLEEKDKESEEGGDTIGDDSSDDLGDLGSSDDSSSSSEGSSNAEIKDQLKLVNDIDKKVSDLRERLIGKFQ